jgi:hypothetical protein
VAIFQSLLSISIVLLALFMIPHWGVAGAAVAYFCSSLVYAILLLVFTRLQSGRWVSLPTGAWFVACGVVLFLATRLVGMTGSAYWGAIPTALSAAICALIYFKVIAKAKAEEAAA